MNRPRFASGYRSLLVLLALAGSPLAQSIDLVVGKCVTGSADVNGDGAVDAEEWERFVASLEPDARGHIDRERVKALVYGTDLNGDGRLTADDVALALEDGARAGMLGALVRSLADGDQDGRVSTQERAAFLAQVRVGADGALELEQLVEWIRAAEALPPPTDRNAMSGGVVFMTVDSAVDVNADGVITRDDLDQHFAALDSNEDGALDAAELTAQPAPSNTGTGPGRGRWGVSRSDRARPPLMPWQRNLEDALALVRKSGKPLLLCVNMDGENASESLAWGRYRDPEFVALADGFVCLVASPDQREPRERDDQGRRLPDRRFGRVVNSEHIDVEPQLYERYFRGNRVAPRHVGVSPEGDILFDVFLIQDLRVIDDKLREFGRPAGATVDVRALSEEELLASPEAGGRDELERRFAEGDLRTRVRLAGLALSGVRAVQHPELLHMALRDESEAVRYQAVWTVFQHAERAPLDVLPAVYATIEHDAGMRAALVTALDRAMATWTDEVRLEDADNLRRGFAALHAPSSVIDVERWSLALALAPQLAEEPRDDAALERTIALLESVDVALVQAPRDLELLVQRSSACMQLARIQLALGGNPSFFFQDAVDAADEALAVGADDPRALGLKASASFMLSDTETAAACAERALPRLVEHAATPLAAEVLQAFARVRTQAFYDALSAGQVWDEAILSDALATWEVLVSRPSTEEAQWRSYLDLLGALSAYGSQADALRRALAQHPASAQLHAYLRYQALRDEGAGALEAAYRAEPLVSARAEHGPALDWFEALAVLVAAERQVENRDLEAAFVAYRRCRELFARSVAATADYEASAAHYSALALAGEARLLAEAGRFDEAVACVLECVRLAPDSVDSPDGLGKTPKETARELRSELRRAGLDELEPTMKKGLAEAGLRL